MERCFHADHAYYFLRMILPLGLIEIIIIPVTICVILVREKRKGNLMSISNILALGNTYVEYKG